MTKKKKWVHMWLTCFAQPGAWAYDAIVTKCWKTACHREGRGTAWCTRCQGARLTSAHVIAVHSSVWCCKWNTEHCCASRRSSPAESNWVALLNIHNCEKCKYIMKIYFNYLNLKMSFICLRFWPDVRFIRNFVLTLDFDLMHSYLRFRFVPFIPLDLT